ncbi:MAG: GNAT family N-acetyltransferase [Agathobacter sp.]|nr:GNAT family N-acetyltransferase [Agathobacter sp.]
MKLRLITNYYDYKQQIVDFVEEYANVEGKMIPSVLGKCDYHNFDEYVAFLERRRTRDLAGLVPATVYFTLDEERNIVVGAVDIRHYLNEPLLHHGGHIGDGVRPSERRKGVATAQIGLALEECKKLGIDKVLITCESWNIPSAKSIINNGGVLENEVEVEGKTFQRYWIDI